MKCLSLKKNKQSGFTLIELMVVMAIIAILATAGLSAYTGYIKKARDAKRITDINTIHKIVMASMSATGMPPQSKQEIYSIIKDFNNNTLIRDPLASSDGNTTKKVCSSSESRNTFDRECSYTYRVCNGGMGYAVGTRFESISNRPLYLTDNIQSFYGQWPDDTLYELGSCPIPCDWGSGTPLTGRSAGCPSTMIGLPNTISSAGTYIGTDF